MLVFSKTTAFRHDSIPAAIQAIKNLGTANNFAVDATEDDTLFTDANLAQYKTIVFLSTTGDPLGTQAEKDAFQRYIEQGGGFVGVHAAADTVATWSWYQQLVGATFLSHPAVQAAKVVVEDSTHAATQGLPASFTRTDEWYDFTANPRPSVHVLTSVDNSSYSGSTMGSDHPTTWCQVFDGGRSFYTALGHTTESWSEANFLHIVLGGILTTSGTVLSDCGIFQKVPLDTNTSNPMMLDVAPDGRVFYIDRLGDVNIIQPAGGTTFAGHLGVFPDYESGLLSIALDPAFATNHWVYLFYSPTTASVDRLSRFTMNGDTLDPASEKVLLDVPVQRADCCHHGAGMVFDKTSGNLWLSTGDNTNPFASDGYTPIDQQAGREIWDAQRTAGNTNSLSGKVLRIHPEANGTYTVPAGNLFAPGTAKTRPEIYTMGERNPFRMGIDPKTGYPLVANYGPDATTANPSRGPENTVEWDILSAPGNAGWPYCIGNNAKYVQYNFATKTSGSAFDCAGGPTNASPNNTGLTKLPPAVPATVWYHYQSDPANFPILSGGAPMAGPVYRYDANLASDRKWPVRYDGRAIFAEWNSSKMYTFRLTADGKGVSAIDPLLPSFSFLKPMDFKFGPDGSLYLIEWGSGFGGDNADSGIYRIDYVTSGPAPTVQATADKTNGHGPLTVNFSSTGSSTPGGGALTYSWVFGDGSTSTAPSPSHTYTANGSYTAVLTLRNANNKTATASFNITVGNTAPTVVITGPPSGAFFQWGDRVPFSVTVSDQEDSPVSCADVHVQAILGHDTHGHPLESYGGCTGTVVTTLSSGHSEGDNIFYVLEASYTDKGGPGAPALTTRSQVILHSKRKQAEFFSNTGRTATGKGTDNPGVQVETGADSAGGGSDIGFIQDGDWWSLEPASLYGVSAISLRVASQTSGGILEAHWDSPTGTVLGTVSVPGTGAWQTYTNVTMGLNSPPAGSGKLYFVARSPSNASGFLFNVNWLDFIGEGVTAPAGTVISLRARINGKYVTAENAGAASLIANRTVIGPWEQFDMIDLGGGNIGLRAHANNSYVCAETAGAAALIANRGAIGQWETFQLIRNADGSVSLKAGINGSYVTADNAGGSPLIANRSAIGPWEKFDLIS
ncbi:ThuA domain-containing protein [Dactylosporangium salmoneum]|uniref:ThuA domain-containing protein n=1 Tax=Dactylosporangium salmoneum TaxID=53361 RepID=A0ABN3FRY8_9ACTN